MSEKGKNYTIVALIIVLVVSVVAVYLWATKSTKNKILGNLPEEAQLYVADSTADGITYTPIEQAPDYK